jgi:hypothetical protein
MQMFVKRVSCYIHVRCYNYTVHNVNVHIVDNLSAMAM